MEGKIRALLLKGTFTQKGRSNYLYSKMIAFATLSLKLRILLEIFDECESRFKKNQLNW
jgi:hypothetical protein